MNNIKIINDVAGFDVIKIQQKMIKSMLSEKKVYHKNVQIDGADFVAVTDDGYALFLIPSRLCALSFNTPESDSLEKIVREQLNSDNSKMLVDSFTTIELQGKKLKLFKTEKGEDITFDEKLLKQFNSTIKLRSKGGAKQAAQVLNGPQIVGIIMPYFVSKNHQ